MKRRQAAIDFITDNLGYTVAYFSNTGLLLLFFYLFYKEIEIVYPFMLSFFVFAVIMTVKWPGYLAYNRHIGLAADSALYKLQSSNNEQRRAGDAFEKIHSDYINKISCIEMDNKDKRRLVSQFIHSLKTPLTVIGLAASTLMEEGAAEIPAVRDILDEKEKMADNLDMILNILRLDEFASDYVPEAVDIETSLRDIVNNHKRNFVYGHVVPKIIVECETPLVFTDPKWNAVMLEQFISNGIKYSMADTDFKYLFLRIKREDGRVMLSICDEGMGIPEHDLSRIPEPFFTGENGRKVRNSSGIGLYMAYRIAGRLNHGIGIRSEPGRGTEVTVTYVAKS